MEIINSLNAMLTLAVLISVGVIGYRQKLINDESSKMIAKICIVVAIPANVFNSLVMNYTRESLLEVISSINVPILAIVITGVLAFGITFITKVPKTRRGVFTIVASFSNTIFMGIPIVTSILGNEALAYLPIYYVANTLLFWTLGLFLIKTDAKTIAKANGEYVQEPEKSKSQKVLSIVQYFINPTILLFVFAIILILCSVKIPVFFKDSVRYLSGSATPLSMIYIGGYLYKIFSDKNVKNFYIKEMCLIIAIKFVVLPMIVFFMLKSIDMPLLLKRTFILVAMMPSMSQTAILPATYKADIDFAVVGNIATLIFTPIALIIYALLMSYNYI